MTKFLDGPATGVTLNLRRAPVYLRVVRDAEGCWDALDQPDDRPRPGESIHAYRKTADHGMIHICSRDKSGRHTGGFFAMASYAFVEPQPDDATIRSNERWRVWAQARRKEGARS